MAKLISKRYATALFELAKEQNNLEELAQQASFILLSFEQNEELYTIFKHPQVSSDKKLQLFKNIFESVSNDILGLVSIIINKSREDQIKNILKAFLDLVQDYNNIKTAYVYSAKQLSQEQVDSIEKQLSQNLNKKIIVEHVLQPDLIGGIKINVAGLVIDNSIKKRLADIKNNLINN